ncbi:hypothetical protein V7111_23430 [Neobacillus niacini]|uniref:hypothetical protein n=1 Tax=Neobacillus niacini TaxID=86668 RepID=UPI0030038837
MEKRQISESFYQVKSRDRVGGTIRTDVFRLESGIFEAFSSYRQDQDGSIVGFATSFDDEYAILQSRKALRKEWKEN